MSDAVRQYNTLLSQSRKADYFLIHQFLYAQITLFQFTVWCFTTRFSPLLIRFFIIERSLASNKRDRYWKIFNNFSQALCCLLSRIISILSHKANFLRNSSSSIALALDRSFNGLRTRDTLLEYNLRAFLCLEEVPLTNSVFVWEKHFRTYFGVFLEKYSSYSLGFAQERYSSAVLENFVSSNLSCFILLWRR